MLEIRTKTASLDLAQDAKITIKKNSPLFSIIDKERKQSYSYPFTLPNSPANNRVISNIVEQEKEETLQAILRSNGVRLLKADVVVTKQTNKRKEIALQLNQKVELFNKPMNSLFDELGTFFITDNNHYVDLQLKTHDNFLVNWNNVTGSVTAIVSGISYTVSNAWDNLLSDLATDINADTANNAIATVTGSNKIRIERDNSSLPFYAYSDNTKTTNSITPNLLGFIPIPNDNNTNKTEAHTHANTVDALSDFRDKDYCFPYFIALDNVVNYHDTTSYTDSPLIQPCLRVTAIIEKVLSLEGWTLDSNFLKEEDIEKLFIANIYLLRREDNVGTLPMQFLQYFYADCLPKVSLSELVNELQKLFCLVVVYDHTSKTLKIEPANNTLSQKFPKVYECTENYDDGDKKKSTGYTFSYDTSNYSQLSEEDLQKINTSFLYPVTLSDGSTEVISNFPFLPTFNYEFDIGFGDSFIGIAIAPEVYVPNSVLKLGYNKGYELFITGKFLLQEGNFQSFNFMNYADDKRAKLNTENYALTWIQLYEQFWKKYIALLDKSEVEREIIFTFTDLQGLDILELIRLEYSNYFIKELEYTLTNVNQIRILGKVKLIKTL